MPRVWWQEMRPTLRDDDIEIALNHEQDGDFVQTNFNQTISTQNEKLEIQSNTTIKNIFNIKIRNCLRSTAIESFLKAQQINYKPSYTFADKSALIGVEVEVENVKYIDPNISLGFWEITTDGSLRNNGREFRTYPMPIYYIEAALKQLFKGLNPDVDFVSPRTSIHIHQDVRGMTPRQIVTLLFTYSVCENLLFKFAGTSRRNSHFCTPITETNLLSPNTASLNALFSSFTRSTSFPWAKYTALNLIPITTLGTVEYRHMPGVTNIRHLLMWIDLISRLKIWAYATDLNIVIERILALNTNSMYLHFLESVFGDAAGYLDQSNLQNDMEKPVYIIKNCAAINQFNQKLMNSFDPKSPLGEFLGLSGELGYMPHEVFAALELINIYLYPEMSRQDIALMITQQGLSNLENIPAKYHKCFKIVNRYYQSLQN